MLLPNFVAAVVPHSPDGPLPASVHLSGRIGKAAGHIGLRQSYHHMMTAPIVGESPMPEAKKARAVGFNHVALEVGDIEEALAFYGRLFDFELRGKSRTSAFIDLGDQFLALQKGRTQPADDGRHFGLVVDDKDAVRRALAAAGIKPLPGRFLDFRDPWGNRIEIVGYDNIQFTKAPNVLRGMGLAHLSKNKSAIKELKDKGMAPS
jgi:lactoylglutathione lyase